MAFLKFNFDLAIEEHCPRRSNHLAHSARADLCRRLGRIPEARASYEKALALARQEPERRFLARRLEELKYKREPGNVPFVLSSQFFPYHQFFPSSLQPGRGGTPLPPSLVE